MTYTRLGVALGALLGMGVHASLAFAAPPETSPSATLDVHAVPVFGQDAASGSGWNEIVARVDNAGASTRTGILEVSSSVSYGREQEFATRAPFSVPGGRSAIVRLPTHGFPPQPATITVTAWDHDGEKLASVPVVTSGTTAPLLVDVDEPSRLAVVLRNASVSTMVGATRSGGGVATPSLTVGTAAFDRTTGDPILPDYAAGYASATVVLIHTDALVRLEAAPLEALTDWVLSGGTLAVVPARPEDLRAPALTTLVGGTAVPAEVPPGLFKLPATVYAAPPSPFSLHTSPPSEDEAPGGVAPPTAPSPPLRTVQVGPSPAVRPRLAGYAGGNLRPSPYGASAPYGMGEVHLLAFDPTQAPMVDDPWVQTRIVDLAVHAWDRRAVNVFPNGTLALPYELNQVRRTLDPNESFRPTLGIAAILLVLYSIVVGPVTFLRAAKKGAPLAPLKWVPLWSATAFAGVVLIGFAGRGWRGRARHLSFLEAGAGSSRGSIRRFRGFFTSEARAVSIAATDRTCVLDMTSDESTRDHHVLRLDRNGGTLENLAALPWQTVVVVEDGFADIHAGVTVRTSPDGSVDLTNQTGQTLRDLIVGVPNKDLAYIPEVANGTTVSSSTGRSLGGAPRGSTTTGSRVVHPLAAADLGTTLDARTATRLRETWQPLETAAGTDVDWWPDDAPVVLAEMAGGEGRTRDSALSVETDRLLLRVVGVGGTP